MLLDNSGKAHIALDSFNVAVCKPGPFLGGTANERGNNGGTKDPLTIFTVTGDVLLKIFGVCTTLLGGATATVEVGLTGNTAGLIAQTVATDIDASEIWNDTTPGVGTDTYANVTGPHIVVNGSDILETIGTTDITSGDMYYVCLWRPLSVDGNVVSAI